VVFSITFYLQFLTWQQKKKRLKKAQIEENNAQIEAQNAQIQDLGDQIEAIQAEIADVRAQAQKEKKLRQNTAGSRCLPRQGRRYNEYQ